MRYVFAGFTLMLALVAYFSHEPAQGDAAARRAALAANWRRTSQGWEPAENWLNPVQPKPAYVPIHPASLAALQVLISVGALLTFEAKTVSPRSNLRVSS